jgi:PST family polysaccharide transporter
LFTPHPGDESGGLPTVVESGTNVGALRARSVKAVFWTAIAKWSSQGISLVVFMVLANLLEPRHFGLLALTAVFVDILDLFLDQGFASALIQKDKLDPEHLDTAFWINLAIGGALMLIAMACAPLIAALFHEPQLTALIAVLSLKFLLRGLKSTQLALLNRAFRFKALAVRTTVPLVVGGAVGIAMAYAGFGVWSLVSQQLVASLVGVAVLWSVSNWRPGWRFSTAHWKELFSFGVNMTGARLVTYFTRRSDDLLIGYFLGAIALGYYAVAYRVLRTLNAVLVGMIESVALPTFSRLQNQLEELRRVYLSVTRATSFLSFPVFVSVAVLAPELTATLFGWKWLPSAPAMRLLALAGLAESLMMIQGTALVALGKPDVRLRIVTIRSAITVCGFAIAVQWGITAVALSFLITSAVITPPIYYRFLSTLLGLQWHAYFAPYVRPLLASAMMAIAVAAAREMFLDNMALYLRLLLCLGVAAASYLLCMAAIAPQLIQQVFALARIAVPARSAATTSLS